MYIYTTCHVLIVTIFITIISTIDLIHWYQQLTFQCLFFLKMIHLQKPYICWLDAKVSENKWCSPFTNLFLYMEKIWSSLVFKKFENSNHLYKGVSPTPTMLLFFSITKSFVFKVYQGIIQKKSMSGSQTLPCLMIFFFWDFILIWKWQKMVFR